MKNAIVVKMGGSVFDSRDTTIGDMVSLQKQGELVVVVHGGGNMVTRWLERQGIATRFVHGERATGADALEVATAVLAGVANKEIVAAIIGAGGRAIGISGVDGAVVQGRIKDRALGYVGEVVGVDTLPLEALLRAGFIAVVSPVSLHAGDRPADAPRLLNINGDIVAGEIAAALGAERLVFLTDVPGIRGRSGELLAGLSPGEARALIDTGVASEGMIPKIRACLRAASGGSSASIVDGRAPHALLEAAAGRGTGTTITDKGAKR